MKTVNFPYLAVVLGVFLLLVVNRGSQADLDGNTALPLLTLLIINECAFFLSIAGAIIGFRQLKRLDFKLTAQPFYSLSSILCLLLTIQFTLLGIKLWPL